MIIYDGRDFPDQEYPTFEEIMGRIQQQLDEMEAEMVDEMALAIGRPIARAIYRAMDFIAGIQLRVERKLGR